LAVGRGWPRLAVFPLGLIAVELLFPMVFPWFTAIFVHTQPVWLQLAEGGGPLVISAWLALVNVCIAEALLRRTFIARTWVAAAGVATLLVVTGIGWLWTHNAEQAMLTAPRLRIGVVQSGIDKTIAPQRDSVVALRADSLTLLRENVDLDLLVWPETAVPYPTHVDKLSRFFRDHALRDRRDGVTAEKITVPLLVGMVLDNTTLLGDSSSGRVSNAATKNDVQLLSNSAVLADPNGRILGIYDKQQLVPIGERAPFLSLYERMDEILPPATQFAITRSPRALPLGPNRLFVSICYEDILHHNFLSIVRETSPDLLINLTSDNWFKGSSAAELHFALAKLRAVEHRRFLLRVTNDGPTAVVAPTGRVIWQLPLGERASGIVEVGLLRERTHYERFGDLPWLGAVGLIMLMTVISRKGITRRN
jgi:apolipoprotein N-acyltransferase